MVTIKKVNEQLEKKNNVNKVWIKENGDLVIHTTGRAACWILDLMRMYVLASA